MRSTLVVTTAAENTAILTLAEMRAAAGVTDASKDALLQTLGDSIAADIMAECNIAAAQGAAEPTLFTETLTETFFNWPARHDLVLSRRHNVVISSVTMNTSLLGADDYVVNGEDGILSHNCGGCSSRFGWGCGGYSSQCGFWCGDTIVVVYSAGFDVVPPGLKQAALDLFVSRYAEMTRDQFVKTEWTEVPGVILKKRDYWVGAIPGQVSQEGPVPAVIATRLKRFRNIHMSIG